MERLRDLPGLGPKSEAWLVEVGIHTPEELRAIGAMQAFIRLQKQCSMPPSMNFLYAMVGAIEGKSWLEIASTQKSQLLMELESHREMELMFAQEDR